MTQEQRENVYTAFNGAFASILFDLTQIDEKDTEKYEEFKKGLFERFDALKPDEIGKLFDTIQFEKETFKSTKSFAKSVACDTMKNFLGRYTISRLSNACAIAEEKAVSNTSRYTKAQKQQAKDEMEGIVSNISADDLAQMYPLITKEYTKAQENTKWMGLLAYDEPQEAKTLPIVSKMIVDEIAEQIPHTLITSKNQSIYRNFYRRIQQPSFLTNATTSSNFAKSIRKSQDKARKQGNRAVVDSCDKMIHIVAEEDVNMLIGDTSSFIQAKNKGSLSIMSIINTQDVLKSRIESIFAVDKPRIDNILLSKQATAETVLADDKSSEEEIEKATNIVTACEYIDGIKNGKNLSVINNQIVDIDEIKIPDDVDIME